MAKNKIEKILVNLIFPFFAILLISIPILAQQIEYNRYLILLYGILQSFGAILTGYLIHLFFINIQLGKNQIRQNIIRYIILILTYFVITILISIGLFSALSSLLAENIWQMYPEYETYVIPTISLSMLLFCRIFGFFEKDIELPMPTISSNLFLISPKDIKKITSDIIIGILIMSIVSIVFIGAGISNITENIVAFNIFVFTASIIVASIDILIWYLKDDFKCKIYNAMTSHSHSVKEKGKLQKQIKNLTNKYPKLVYLLYAIIILAFIMLIIISPKTSLICSNTTVIEVNVAEINTNTTETSINETNALIPLVIIENEKKPLTDRIKYLSDGNLISYRFLNRSLEISTKTGMYPLIIKSKVGSNSSKTIKNPKNSLNCYPQDYDATIIYALYNNGYHNFSLACDYQDYGTMVFADKTFFNLENKNNIAIHLHVTGTTLSIVDFKITIVTLNETAGKNIKVLLEEDRAKANIEFINNDPKNYAPFNCPITEN